ncbi:lysozyme family protein [Magnetospirillum molischianum]|uniref:Uncharacterized protein n=1 Tax=Magnetospirillum molischianum DSM 120 TaxID=1150626 RepID=H8FUG6_MAGML|nr:hypothetical protein [Magnetospirillum molischianum]CCG42004.1 hypothetical protein PHAMO_30160 [Magnetospirillum molischianum DSM 120]
MRRRTVALEQGKDSPGDQADVMWRVISSYPPNLWIDLWAGLKRTVEKSVACLISFCVPRLSVHKGSIFLPRSEPAACPTTPVSTAESRSAARPAQVGAGCSCSGASRGDYRSAVAGILQKTLDDARGRVPGLGRSRTPGDLTPDQQAALYRDYLNQALARAGGYQALNGIGNDYAAAVLADTLFRFGPGGGARIIQAAINAVVPDSVNIDGVMRPQTLAIFSRLASDPAMLRQLLDAVANIRDRRLDGKEADRTDHFRFLRE